MAKQAARIVKNKFFVANLHWSCSEGVLRTYFQQFGPVTHAEIVFDMKTGMSKCFGFVRMRNDADFQKALEEKKHVIEGMQAFVKQYTVEDRKVKRKKKLGTSVDRDSISGSIPRDGTGVPPGYDTVSETDDGRTTSNKESSV